MNTRILLASSIGGIILLGSACTQPSDGVHDYNAPPPPKILTCHQQEECLTLAHNYPDYLIQFRPQAEQTLSPKRTANPHPSFDSTPPDVSVCQEDQPCWNPQTMGNHRGTKH